MMKNLNKILIVIAAIVTVVAIISRITLIPVMGIESRAMAGFAALLLLFVIALESLK